MNKYNNNSSDSGFETIRIEDIGLPSNSEFSVEEFPSQVGQETVIIGSGQQSEQRGTAEPEPTVIVKGRGGKNDDEKTILIGKPSAKKTTGPKIPTQPLPFEDDDEEDEDILSREEWVQGWLVAITGPMKGKAFPVGYGFNHIGRSSSNRIVLAQDKSISSKQIIIYYKPKQHTFYVEKAPESTQMTELSDGDIVTAVPSPLVAGETLKMSSQTTLRFVPFCGEDFSWDYNA